MAITKVIEAQEFGIFCSILLLDESGRHLYAAAAPSLPAEFNAAVDGLEIGPMQGACGAAAYLNQRVIIEDTLTDPKASAFVDLCQRFSLRSVWSEPIRSRQGTVLGTFAIYSDHCGTPNDLHVRFIESSARLAGIALDRGRSERELRASEYRFQALAELAPAGIYRADAAGQTIYINPRGLELLGQSLENARGLGWSAVVHPNDAERVMREWRNRLGQAGPTLCEFRIVKSDNESTWVISQSRPEFDDNGKIVGYVGTITDISHRKLYEQELAQARDSAEAASRGKDRLLAMLRNELRSPLKPALAKIDGLQARPDVPTDLRAELTTLRQCIDTQARLIEDLLDFTRVKRPGKES
jgi:PAS domain S-box-containing protein